MTATTDPRFTALLNEAADRYPVSNPNHNYHRRQHVLRAIARDESEAYAIEDRRTIRARFTAQLRDHMHYTRGQGDAAVAAYHTAVRMLRDSAAEDADKLTVELRQRAERDARRADEADARYRALSDPTSTDSVLLDAAEADEIAPCMLLSTIPDPFGRVSPFAVDVRIPGARGYVSRNLTLSGALAAARAARASGNVGTVIYDLCG